MKNLKEDNIVWGTGLKQFQEEESKRFDEEFVDTPEPYVMEEPPYKIGERNYTGEHMIFPAHSIKGSPGEIKRYLLSRDKRLIEKIVEVVEGMKKNERGDTVVPEGHGLIIDTWNEKKAYNAALFTLIETLSKDLKQ